MSPFLLFGLPLVPIGNILDLISPFQLIELSKTSKKAATQVKLRASKNLRIALDFNYLILQITSIKNLMQKSQIMIQEQGSRNGINPSRLLNAFLYKANPDYEEKIISVMSNETFSKLEEKGFYIADLLGYPIHDLRTGSLPADVFLRVVPSILKRQTQLNVLNIRSMKLQENQLIEVLNKLKITEKLVMDSELSPQFPFALFNDLEMIEITNAPWFELDMLFKTNCKKVDLFNSKLSNQDLDLYLKMWKHGNFPNLKLLHIESDKFDDETQILGMVPPIRDTNNIITRDDGVVAKLKLEYGTFDLTV